MKPLVAFISVWIFILLAYYSYKYTHRDFVLEQLSQYDGSKTKPYASRPNVLVDSGLIYQTDLADMYDTKPVILINGDNNE